MTKIGESQRVLILADEAVRLVQRCHAIRVDQKRRLKKAFREGNGQRQRKLMDSYFRNDKVKISALSKAGIRKPGKHEWQAEARMFDPFAPSQETLEWWHVPKGRQGARIVCDLAPWQRPRTI